MRFQTLNTFIISSLITLTNCSQENKAIESTENETTTSATEINKSEPHQYGGWYCPDNLNGFPAVDIANWKSVPVINGRLATPKETQTEASLINVDLEKYPNARPLDMTMPKLASIYNYNTNREDIIIIIQALNIDNDSIVGFRYLNGGNGSARLDEVNFLSDEEIDKIPTSKFVTHTITINATQDEIWKILTQTENAATLQPIFDSKNSLQSDWRKATNVNYHYSLPGITTASFAGNLYGCYYVQNDYDFLNYTEKFLLIEDEETKTTELKITCGPYEADYEAQQIILINWSEKVKELSEAALKHYIVPSK